MFTTHFWTYLPIELSDLTTVFGEIFNVENLYHDYEDKWEWLEGESLNLKANINIRREHNWESGNYTKPINISVTTPQILSHDIILGIKLKLCKRLKSVVFEEAPNDL